MSSNTIADLVAALLVGPVMCADHAARTGLDIKTVRRHMKILAARKLVRPAGHGKSCRGLKPTLWAWDGRTA